MGIAATAAALAAVAWAGGPRDRATLGELRQALAEAVRARDVSGIARDLEAVARIGSVEAARLLLASYAQVEDLAEDEIYPEDRYRIYVVAARALAKMRERAAAAALPRMARTERHWAARFLILTAAPAHPGLDAVELSIATLKFDKHPVVLRRAIDNLGRSRSRKAIEPLLGFFERLERRMGPRRPPRPIKRGRPTAPGAYRGPEWDRVWLAARDALERLFGRGFASAADYRNWYRAHEDEVDPANPSPPRAAERTGLGLFGLEVTGWNIAFVIDVSGSMETTDPWPEGERPRGPITSVHPEKDRERMLRERMRIVRAKRELERVVRALPADRRFNIIAFSSDVRRWKDYQVPASKEKRGEAVAFVRGLKAEGITVTDWALEQALLDPVVDTIYLVTDGAPTHVGGGGPGLPRDAPRLIRQIIQRVRALNYRRGVRIYTLGFRGAEEEFLKTLARENRGKYKPIR